MGANGEPLKGTGNLRESVAYQIDGKTICAFDEASAWPTESFIAKFRDELTAHTKSANKGKLVAEEAQLAAAGLD